MPVALLPVIGIIGLRAFHGAQSCDPSQISPVNPNFASAQVPARRKEGEEHHVVEEVRLLPNP